MKHCKLRRKKICRNNFLEHYIRNINHNYFFLKYMSINKQYYSLTCSCHFYHTLTDYNIYTLKQIAYILKYVNFFPFKQICDNGNFPFNAFSTKFMASDSTISQLMTF